MAALVSATKNCGVPLCRPGAARPAPPARGATTMRAGFLPKLLFSPSVFLVLVCVYGYIMFTVYLSFTTSTMMPMFEWAGPASYTRLLNLENWEVSVSNLAVFASLYIVVAMALGLT